MFLSKSSKEPSGLDLAIDAVLTDMKYKDAESDEYAAMTDQLVKLMKVRKETQPSWRPSADTVAVVAANLLGILLILNFERAGIVTSKALSFVKKMQ